MGGFGKIILYRLQIEKDTNVILFRTILLLLAVGMTGLASAQATTGYLHVYCKDTALGNKHGLVPAYRWNHNAATWDGHLTSAGRKFDHSHAAGNFPAPVPPSEGYSGNEITAAEVDAYFAEVNPHHTKISTASTTNNCHGFTTGKGMHVEINKYGVIRVVDDEYEVGTAPENKYVFEPEVGSGQERGHSYKITDWSSSTNECGGTVYTPSKVQEKWNTGPTLEITWTDTVAYYNSKTSWDKKKKK